MNRAVQQKDAAEHENDKVHQAVKRARGCLKAAHPEVIALFDGEPALIAFGKFLFFRFFAGKGLDHADAEQRIFDLCIDFTDLPARFFECFAHAAVKLIAADKHNRQNGKGEQRQRHVDRQQNGERYNDFDTGDEKFLRTMMGKFRDVK